MMGNDEYELMPHRDIVDLKNQLQRLKGGKASAKGGGSQLDNLLVSLNTMNNLFSEALNEMKLGDQDEISTYKHVQQLSEKFDTLISQNEKIAEGIVALADMIKGIKTETPKMDTLKPLETKPQPLQQPAPHPLEPQPHFGAPPSQPGSPGGAPPPSSFPPSPGFPPSQGLPPLQPPIPGGGLDIVGTPDEPPKPSSPIAYPQQDEEQPKRGLFGRLGK